MWICQCGRQNLPAEMLCSACNKHQTETRPDASLRFRDIKSRWDDDRFTIMLPDIQWLIDFAERVLGLDRDAKP